MIWLLLCSTSVWAQGQYYTSTQVLTLFFKNAARVDYQKLSANQVRSAFEQWLHAPPTQESYIVYVAYNAQHAIQGYGVIDDERGQHKNITLATHISPQGQVVQTEVMTYREAYGEEIRHPRFLKQYTQKTLQDTPRFQQDIASISGATLSCRAMSRAVQRALALVSVLQQESH